MFQSNVNGGGGANSGIITIYNSAKDITIQGNLAGGTVADTGNLIAAALTGKLIIGGDVSGYDNSSDSGKIELGGTTGVKSIEIKGDLKGGNSSMGSIVNSGAVLVTGALKSLTIGGNINSGAYFDNTCINLGAVRTGFIDTMLVKGKIQGQTNSPVVITAFGDATKTSGANVAIKSLTVLGSVNEARILAGYTLIGTTQGGDGGSNGGAQIGTVTIGGDFFNSSIAAGVKNTTGFGDWASGSNTLLDAANPIIASIAKIVIQGSATATATNGVSAEQINSLKIGGTDVVLAGQPLSFAVSGSDFRVQRFV